VYSEAGVSPRAGQAFILKSRPKGPHHPFEFPEGNIGILALAADHNIRSDLGLGVDWEVGQGILLDGKGINLTLATRLLTF
jgi:hypothetical protein